LDYVVVIWLVAKYPLFFSGDKPIMRLTNLTSLILQLNALIDTGKYTWISLADIKVHVETGEIFRYIAQRGKGDIDLSFLGADIEEEIVAELKNMLAAHAGGERRKWGVINSGLCLLIAYVTELIQLGSR